MTHTYTIQSDSLSDVTAFLKRHDEAEEISRILYQVHEKLRLLIKHCEMSKEVEDALSELVSNTYQLD